MKNNFRTKVRYSGGTSDNLLDAITGYVYNVENDMAKLQERGYEIERSYSSQSGLSGNFEITSANSQNLVRLGYVRVDIRGVEQYPRYIEINENKLFIYVTIHGHDGFEKQGCPYIIISDGQRVFIHQCEFDHNERVFSISEDTKKALRNWDAFWEELEKTDEIRSFEFKYYIDEKNTYYRDIICENLYVQASGQYIGFDLSRFIDLRKYRIDSNFVEEFRGYPVNTIEEKLSSFYHKEKWYTIENNLITQEFDSINEVAEYMGYVITHDTDGKAITYLRERIGTNFIITGFSLGDKTYKNEAQMFEYELEQNIFEPITEDTYNRINRGLKKKIRLDYITKEREKLTAQDIFIKLLLTRSDTITLTDSTSVGNCEYGSVSFCKNYGIIVHETPRIGKHEEKHIVIEEKYILIKDILKNKDRKKILENNDFKKVVYNKFFKKEEEEEA